MKIVQTDTTGRCTRAYSVYEAETGRLFFFKDSWRAQGLEKVSSILREFEAAKMQHVPGYVCGDDLRGPRHITVTDLYIPTREHVAAPSNASSTINDPLAPQRNSPANAGEQATIPQGRAPGETVIRRPGSAAWRCGHNWKRIIRRYHHRMIRDFIGKQLKMFSSSKEMMQAVSRAFTARR
ncbi:hypothetical protein LshimejAT787_0805340 [Lyophyllum shimeji]|uniref:Fungal-type protein kinase domain-containing protein n=1 Tax=Lyophyllum shimeji TaxID=47721 RepID=A0A9P3PRG0_LYOSH|nr:hypothetical protein LshimejAT787_0805340 [Lyophyllum shimeji]